MRAALSIVGSRALFSDALRVSRDGSDRRFAIATVRTTENEMPAQALTLEPNALLRCTIDARCWSEKARMLGLARAESRAAPAGCAPVSTAGRDCGQTSARNTGARG